MTEKNDIEVLKENGIKEANLVKKDIIIIVKTTLYSFLIFTFLFILLRIF